MPTEFAALVDRFQFLFWRNMITWSGAPPFIANLANPNNKQSIEMHKTREALTILMIILRNCIPGYEVDFEHTNKMFGAMDEELKHMDINSPSAREQEVRANLVRNMSFMHAASNVFLNSAYKDRYAGSIRPTRPPPLACAWMTRRRPPSRCSICATVWAGFARRPPKSASTRSRCN